MSVDNLWFKKNDRSDDDEDDDLLGFVCHSDDIFFVCKDQCLQLLHINI